MEGREVGLPLVSLSLGIHLLTKTMLYAIKSNFFFLSYFRVSNWGLFLPSTTALSFSIDIVITLFMSLLASEITDNATVSSTACSD